MARPAPTARYARSGELSIAYVTHGAGPLDVVLVPGFVSHLDLAWEEPLRRQMANSIAGFGRFITFDKRGTGLSDRSVSAVSSMEDRMDDIRAVMDAVGSERAAIIGYSEGGPLAVVFAATYPDRVTSLVLASTWSRPIELDDLEERLKILEDTWGTGFAISEVFIQGSDPEWAARYERSSATPKAAADLLRLNVRMDISHTTSAISVPTLVIHRRGDTVVPVEYGRDLAASISGARYVEVEADTHLPATPEALEEEMALIEEFLTGSRRERDPDRVLATVMFTDICSSTERAASLGDRAWRDVLVRHHDEATDLIGRYRGRQVKSTGDGVLATFDGPTRAVRCATELVESAKRAGVEVRAGLHTGEVELMGNDIAGIAVHLAQRVESKAEPGSVFVSQTVRDLLAGSSVELDDRGIHALKGVPGEWRLFAVTGAG